MAELNVTLIDVGWGDSIFIEHIDDNDDPHYGLIDSNDKEFERSAEIFIKKYLRRNGIKYKDMRNKGLCFIMSYELLLNKNKSIRGGRCMKCTIVKLEDKL